MKNTKPANRCVSIFRSVPYRTLLRGIGIVLFIYVITTIDWNKVMSIIDKVSAAVLFVTPLITAVVIILKGARWHYVLQSENIVLSKKRSAGTFFNGLLAGLITPGRFGELIRINALRKTGASFTSSIAATLKDRMIDLAFFTLLTIISFFLFFDMSHKQIIITVIISATFFGACVLGIGNFRNIVIFCIERIPLRVLKKYGSENTFTCNPVVMPKNRKTEISCLITILVWSIHFALMMHIAQDVDIKLTFFQTAGCISLVVLVALLPVTIAGLGTRDLTLIFLFKRIGLEPEQAIVFSMAFLYIHLMFMLIAAISWLFLTHFFNVESSCERINPAS